MDPDIPTSRVRLPLAEPPSPPAPVLPALPPSALRGAGASTDAVFRDPPSADPEADALRLRIAEALVGATKLPVALPAFGLTLLDVHTDRRGIEIRLGFDAPVAALRLQDPPAESAADAVVTVSVVTLQAAAGRYTRALEVMAARLRKAITRTRWDRAKDLARELRRLPAGVPLGFFRQLVAGLDHPEGLVRTGFNCNQDCGMCWQGRDWGRHGPDQVLRWIEDLRAAGARALIVSGGEPSLDPRLEDYVRHARALGFTQVTLETNAVQCAKPGYAERLRDAGVTTAFVSLHSPDPAVSDAITRAPGTHVRTIRGVRALLAAGVPVKLNAVMTAEGLATLGELPDYIAAEFGAYRDHLRGLMLSYPSQPFDPALGPGIVPEPVALRAALRRALALDLHPHGLDGPCGPPLCAFGADPRVADLRPVPGPVDFRHQPAPCADCAVRTACFGVRTADVQLYGDACVAPLAEVPARVL